jgi:tRNA(Ile)-lysidine synthase
VPKPNAPPDAAIARFRSDLLTCGCVTGTIGICVSGGPDSLALLLLAHASVPSIKAATVDHDLRDASKGEAAFVADLCAQLGIAHVTLRLSPPEGGNRSHWARTARYAALRKWKQQDAINMLMTAHHSDDQLETILMRLNRGSGVAGLAGVRARQADLCRPLLNWRKSELIELVAACGVQAIDDPTNYDDDYDRARLRKHLASADWLNPLAASVSAAALAEANDALDWAAARLLSEHGTVDETAIILMLPQLPRELVRRVTLACLTRINLNANPRGAALDRLIAQLHDAKTVTLAGVKCSGGECWRFTRAAPRRTN